jgi:hypothetical protein
VLVEVKVGVRVGVAVLVGVAVGVDVLVGVDVGVGVCVGVGVQVGTLVGVDVYVGVPGAAHGPAPTTKLPPVTETSASYAPLASRQMTLESVSFCLSFGSKSNLIWVEPNSASGRTTKLTVANVPDPAKAPPAPLTSEPDFASQPTP